MVVLYMSGLWRLVPIAIVLPALVLAEVLSIGPGPLILIGIFITVFIIPAYYVLREKY
jgi:hypothetical protein